MTNLIKNTNGGEYIILDQKGDYTLLENTKGGYTPFVVAYRMKEFDKGYSWEQGHYFETDKTATECFVEKAYKLGLSL